MERGQEGAEEEDHQRGPNAETGAAPGRRGRAV
jgi:hypothetical protein